MPRPQKRKPSALFASWYAPKRLDDYIIPDVKPVFFARVERLIAAYNRARDAEMRRPGRPSEALRNQLIADLASAFHRHTELRGDGPVDQTAYTESLRRFLLEVCASTGVFLPERFTRLIPSHLRTPRP